MTTSKQAAIAVWKEIDNRLGLEVTTLRYRVLDELVTNISTIIDEAIQKSQPSILNDLGAGQTSHTNEECGLCERCTSNVPEQKLTEWVGQGIMICDDCRAWMIPGSPGLILKIVRENLAKLGLTEEEIAKLETEEAEP